MFICCDTNMWDVKLEKIVTKTQATGKCLLVFQKFHNILTKCLYQGISIH